MNPEKKNDSVELQIRKQLNGGVEFFHAGKLLPVAKIVNFHTFEIQEGDFKDGNLQYTGIVELYVNVLEGDICSKFYKMMGTADLADDGEVKLTTPVYLLTTAY